MNFKTNTRKFCVNSKIHAWGVAFLAALLSSLTASAQVVINEFHYDPPDKTSPAEFVELYNAGGAPVDVSNWYLAGGVFFQIPSPTTIPVGGYLVIAQDPATVLTEFGMSALGPWEGRLSNDGEAVTLNDSTGVTRDKVEYGRGFPWPMAALGGSMELLNPALDNDLGGSWRTAGHAPDSGGPTTYLAAGDANWSYRKGTSEASSPTHAWRLPGFTEDGTWATGATSIGYGDEDDNTILDDMRYSYTTVYLRNEFVIPAGQVPNTLTLSTYMDDGGVIWINNTEVLRQNASGGTIAYNGSSQDSIGEAAWASYTLENASAYLNEGVNTIAVHGLNSSDSSSDLSMDFSLVSGAGAGGSAPTPGAQNSVFVSNAPPQMRQAEHSPKRPESGEAITISLKVSDPNGVSGVWLEYQVVNPGDYIDLEDSRYDTQWTTVAMADDGTGEGRYAAVLPGGIQQNRRLVRYRFRAEDGLGAEQAAPYADDPTPNFAYFVYDGVPSWTGADRPGVTAPATYDSALLDSLPVYHLITTRKAHEDSQFIPDSTRNSGYTGSEYLWFGTFVYEGDVYDHVRYRPRGGVWRYARGKNMWKFNFNLGNRFAGRDNYGDEYDVKQDKLNFSPAFHQAKYLVRGEQGLIESLAFRMFDLLGVEAPNTNFLHFRIVESASETGATQYDGDFQGLYLAIEQLDGRMLDQHGMPDGNFYKMEGGSGELNNQGPTQPSNKSDLNTFLNTYNNTTPSDQWWRENLDLDRYYSYRSIVETIHHYDIHAGKNYFYFHNPVNGKWEVHPWDVDLTFGDNMYGNGNEPFKSRVLGRAVFAQEYRNRMREIQDLFTNPEQMSLLVEEHASFIESESGPSFVDADRARWDYDPLLTSSYIVPDRADVGRFYESAATNDFPGMKQHLLDYVAYRTSWIQSTILTDEGSIPDTPTIAYAGPQGYPVNALNFSATLSGSALSNFAALEWRAAEITDATSQDFDPTKRRKYEIQANWESGEITPFSSMATVPSAYIEPGKLYRVRVRVKDTSNRFSHWSAPVQFTAGESTGVQSTNLRITELMYNPLEGGAEFLELQNTGGTSINLSGAYFSDGIDFIFPGSTTLGAGQYLVLVSDGDADVFTALYPGVSIGGLYDGKLSNSGETLTLRNASGALLLSFTYNDGLPWPGTADGMGFSMTLTDTNGDANDGTNWRASAASGGSPGAVNPVQGIPRMMINEVLTHTDLPQVDSIEIYNASGVTADIRGWLLTDDRSDPARARIPYESRFLIPSGGYVVIDESDFTDAPGSGYPGFRLSSHGESVCIYSANLAGTLTGYSHGVEFDAAERGVSFGRYTANDGTTHFVAQAVNTLGAANGPPQVGPMVISEILYSPGGGQYEYIELTNISGGTVKLYDDSPGGNPSNTYEVNGVGFAFPGGLTVRPGGKMLIVNAPDGVFLTPARPFGNASGDGSAQLDNAGETVTLEWPDKPDLEGVPYIAMDRVTYSPAAPWPNAAGNGLALHRVNNAQFGNEPGNWIAAAPSYIPNPLSEGGGGPVIWVDLDFVGTELGSQANPFNTFLEGVYVVAEGGTLKFNGATFTRKTGWTGPLAFPVRIEADPVGSFKIGE